MAKSGISPSESQRCPGLRCAPSGLQGARMKRIAMAMMLTIIALPAQAQQQVAPPCGAPAALDDGWLIDKPENVGLDGSRLCGIAARLSATNANVHAVVVVRKGKLVYEHHASGHDEPWGAPEAPIRFQRYDQA